LHARSLGADSVHAASIDAFRAAMEAARAATGTQVIVINTTHTRTTDDGGCWWEVAIPEVSERAEVGAARAAYVAAKKEQHP
jgi:3D-(3,5/4)-trihydroxycyclohexane-1,2-dione acylhydrolase (decyclizing)